MNMCRANAERLLWLTGFAGSAGIAVVLGDKAALFVDGRYGEQAKAQVDGSIFELHHLIDDPPGDWLARNLRPGRQDRLRPAPAHARRGGAIFGGVRNGRRRSRGAIEPNPIDYDLARPARAAGRRRSPQRDMRFAGESAGGENRAGARGAEERRRTPGQRSA